MSAHAWQNAALAVVLLAAGAAAWTLRLRAPLEVQAESLDGIAMEIAGWRGRDIPLEETVERMLRADRNVQRTYVDPAGGVVWLYVGYYGTERGGRSEHSPFVCYPSAGFSIVEGATRTVTLPGGGRATEIRVGRAGDERLVHFWYRSHRSAHLVGAVAHAWDRFVGRIADGRADGAFVRISAPIDGMDVDAIRARLFRFGAALDEELAAHWP
ncbi:MAG: EpsI family protein, partial [Myxococcales bacterium]|nr:EpsI family protein [Myxococcales bacterium]